MIENSIIPDAARAGATNSDDVAPIFARDFGDFTWGAATSAYQIEGAHNADGKVDSIWDTFVRRRGKIKSRESGAVACDHYRRFDSDVALMRDLSLQAYRFSIAWTRIFNAPRTRANDKGIDYYQRLIDALLEAGIEPFVTLYHWDLPQYLENTGGWTNRDTISYFCDYATECARRFGDRVRNFIVFNEPMIFLSLGYLLGIHAPGRRGFKNFFAASHNVLLAQAEAAREMRRHLPNAQIGTTISATAAYAASASTRDTAATARFDTLYNTFYLEPVIGRGYPTQKFPVLKKIEKYIQPGDMEKIKFDFDFWGLNTYTRKIVRYSRYLPYTHWRELKNAPNTRATALNWEIYPEAIYDLLKKYSAYPEIKKIYITENGAAFHDELVAGRVADHNRIDYLKSHLREIARARNEGAKVAGYFIWSLLDNFEWAEGYHARFGLVHINFLTQARRIKDSGYWYRDFIRGKTHC